MSDPSPNLPTPEAALAPPPHSVSRRQFVGRMKALGTAAAAVWVGSAASRGSGVARGATEAKPAPKRRRYGMVIDTRRCVGCRACVVACKQENETPPGVYYTVVIDQTVPGRLDDKPMYMTKPCFHCENPPCVPVCPVSATYKRKQDGIVVVDYDRCIGCRYCVTACPYGARWFDFGENYESASAGSPYATVPSPEYKQFRKREAGESPIGNVRKCTFCLHLQDDEGAYDKQAGRWPACAKTCTGHAIHFGDLNDPTSEPATLLRERAGFRLKDELGTQPNVSYLL